MFSWRKVCSLVLPMSLLFNVGCSDGGDNSSQNAGDHHDHGHDHGHGHDHAHASLKDALAELTSLRDIMKDAFAKNDMDAAHDPLHEVGHVLEAIPELAAKENLSAESQEVIKASVNTLMDAFGAVDKTMHGQEGSTYGEESELIDKTLAALTAACEGKPATEAPATEAPATEAPATEAPATEAPATEAPATEAPATEAPATEAPGN